MGHQAALPTLSCTCQARSPSPETTQAAVTTTAMVLHRAPLLQPLMPCLAPTGSTWAVKEVTLAHVGDVQALQQQHEAAQAGLADVGRGAGGQALLKGL